MKVVAFPVEEHWPKKYKKRKRQTPVDLGLECISLSSVKCLAAVCAHLPQTEEGHLTSGGFPYLLPASGNLKYITRLAEFYFNSLENR